MRGLLIAVLLVLPVLPCMAEELPRGRIDDPSPRQLFRHAWEDRKYEENRDQQPAHGMSLRMDSRPAANLELRWATLAAASLAGLRAGGGSLDSDSPPAQRPARDAGTTPSAT